MDDNKIMNKIKKILESLNLLYYEYNTKSNILFVDQTTSQENINRERVKATYCLTSNDIEFFIDEDENIVISHKDTFLTRLAQRYKNFLNKIKNNRKNIYVLSEKNVKDAHNLPMFDIKYLEKDVELETYDALVFTSKNAIKALASLNDSWKKIPSYVIAPQTAKVLKTLDGTLSYVGKEHHGNEFAHEISDELCGKKVLYVCGAKVVSNLVNILNNNGVLCESLVVYETVCKNYDKEIKLPKNSIIIFSSPSTIECFFKNVKWDKSFEAVSIGQTTAQYFPEYVTPHIAESTSLISCVQKAQELS